jgi:hypothetical protein
MFKEQCILYQSQKARFIVIVKVGEGEEIFIAEDQKKQGDPPSSQGAECNLHGIKQ